MDRRWRRLMVNYNKLLFFLRSSNDLRPSLLIIWERVCMPHLDQQGKARGLLSKQSNLFWKIGLCVCHFTPQSPNFSAHCHVWIEQDIIGPNFSWQCLRDKPQNRISSNLWALAMLRSIGSHGVFWSWQNHFSRGRSRKDMWYNSKFGKPNLCRLLWRRIVLILDDSDSMRHLRLNFYSFLLVMQKAAFCRRDVFNLHWVGHLEIVLKTVLKL